MKMNITSDKSIEDITSEIDSIEDSIPDDELDVSSPLIDTTEQPVSQNSDSEEVLPEQPEVPVEAETPTEEIPSEDRPIEIGFMEQLGGIDIVEDIYDRAGITMILLGESARGLHDFENPFHYVSDRIHVALRNNDRAHFERTIHAMGDAWRIPFEYTDDYFEFKVGPITVTVEYVDQVDKPFYNFPDNRFWQVREMALPNPYSDYIEDYDNK